MKANTQKLQLAMARACITSKEIAKVAGMPRPTVNNVISGRSVKPGTLGRVAKALGVDPQDIIESED